MAGESLKSLRRRIRSVKGIGKITRAMEMVAAAKLRRAQATLLAGRPYAAKLQELLAQLAGGSALAEHPLFRPREGRRKLLVLVTADRGLSGAFNSNVIRRAEELLKSEPETEWTLFCLGRKGRDYFARRQWPVLDAMIGVSEQPDSAVATGIAGRLLDLFQSGQFDSIWLLYSAYISTVIYRPTLAQYLPMTPEALGLVPDARESKRHGEVEYIFDPNPAEVFDQLLPRYLSSRVYITLAEVATSVQSARMIAMNNATKNCNEMADSLTLRMNRARQDTITKELLEIVGGAEALQKG